MIDSSSENKKTADALSKSLDVFEERARAMRILYDTLIAIENIEGKKIYKLLCNGLLEMTNAQFATFSSYDEVEKKVVVQAACTNYYSDDFSNIIGFSKNIDKKTYVHIKENKIYKCKGSECFMGNTFEPQIQKMLGCKGGDVNCYQLSCICDGKLLAFATVKMPKGRMLKLKDIVDTYLNMSGVILRRLNVEEELKNSLVKLDNVNKLIKEQQAQIVHQEKMASIGQLVSGVAHEINNPLNYILGNIFVLSEYIKSYSATFNIYKEMDEAYKSKDEKQIKQTHEELKKLMEEDSIDYMFNDVFDLIGETENGARRVAEIVQNLKLFSRSNVKEFRDYDINEGISSTVSIVSNEIKYKCELKLDLQEVGKTSCNIGQLNQVFLNLILNAVQSMESKKFGLLEISTKREDDNIIIEFKDDGCGMSEEQLEKIFDPFYTTKEVGKGTGLGLSISHGIIKEHGGDIFVESKLEEGSTFKIVMPVIESQEFFC
jgi:signal transduction histidine kinase